MLIPIFTLDYEIHGNGDGSPWELMVEPTDRLLKFFDRFGAKLTIMADAAEILRFKQYKEETGRDDFSYNAIAEQLQRAIRTGHDVQLHLHSSYFNARAEGGRWKQDWAEYNFAGLPYPRMEEMIRIGKSYLERLLQPIEPSYRCWAFRAANWSVSPSRNVVRALVANDIELDTSVFKYGQRSGIVNFDYSNAHSAIQPWRARESDICLQDESSPLWEAPIYCERRWIGAFLSANRIHRALSGSKHKIEQRPVSPGAAAECKPVRKSKWLQRLSLLTESHAWKADFNQCTGRQLIRALNRADAQVKASSSNRVPFVLIGHSKIYTRYNERSLKPFLEAVAANPQRFQFGTFATVLTPQCQNGARNGLGATR